MRGRIWIGILGAFLLAAGGARAEDTAPGDGGDAYRADMRCFVIATQMAASDQGTVKAAGMVAGFYWMGRLDGREPGANMEDRMMAELPKFDADSAKSEALRCGAELTQRGEAVTAMGKDIQRRAAEMLKEQNAH